MQNPAVATSPASVSRWLGPAAAGLFIAAVVALNQSVIHRRENAADSHLFAYYGWAIAHGARPYIDTWDNKPPGIWWANALAFAAFGDSTAVETVVGGAALLVSLLAASGIVASLWRGTFLLVALPLCAAVLTHLAFECGANRSETLVNSAELLGVFAYVRWLATHRRRWLVAAGVCLGLAPWCKQSGLGAAAACGLHLLIVSRPIKLRTIATAIAGFLTPTLAFSALLAAQGALGEAWYAMVQFNRLYFEIGDAGWHGIRVTALALGPHLAPLAWLWALAAVGFAACAASTLRFSIPRFGALNQAGSAQPAENPAAHFRGVTGLFAAWLVVNLLLVSIGVGRLAYHTMVTLPPLALLAVQGLAVVIGVARRDCGATNFIARLVRSPRSAAAATLGLAVAATIAADSAREGARFASCSSAPSGDSPNAVQRGWEYIPDGFAAQAHLIRQFTAPTDTIYVWGWSPGSYRYAYRRCPSRFATIEKVGQLRGRARFLLEEVTATLQRDPPAVFMISPNDLDGLLQPPRDEFAEWVNRTYQRVAEINGMWIMRRAGPGNGPE